MIYRLCGKHVSRTGGLFFRAFSILFISVYFVPSVLAAEVFIPAYLAQTRDRSEGTNGKTVVIVEEAHVNYEAQKAIVNILQDLAENESLRDIFVEGGWGDVSLTPLRQLTGPEHRKEVAEAYLRQGKISGDEYLSLATDLDIRLWGVEAPELYEANMKVFLEFSVVRSKLLSDLSQLTSQIQNLQSGVFTPAMLEILSYLRDFESQKISLLDYAQFVMKRLPGEAQRYPQLVRLMALTGQNGIYDPDKLTVEKKSVIQFLSKKLTKPELEDILALENQKTSDGELAFLDALLKKTHELSTLQSFPAPKNLIAYRNILREIVRMDTAAIFPELEQAEQEVLSAQKPTPEQMTLLTIVRGSGTLQKLFDLRLTETEFLGLDAGAKNLRLETWNGFLTEMCRKHGITYQPFDAKEFSKWIPVALSFYQTARAREKAMIENFDREIKDRGLGLAVLVAGGFHSRNIFDALKKQGYTVVLISPRFTPSDNRTQHEQYLEVLKSKWTEKEVPSSKLQDPSAKFSVPSSKIN